MGVSAIFMNEKGGVGKSSITWSVACYEASKGRKVLLIDCDAQRANITFFAGVEKTVDTKTLFDIMYKDAAIEDVRVGVRDNLDLVPATTVLSNVSQTAKISRLKAVISSVKDQYDLILFDVNPDPNWIHVLVLSCVEHVVITMWPDVTSLEANMGIVESIREIQASTNPGLSILGILFNQNENRTNLSKEVRAMAEKMAASLNTTVFSTLVRRQVSALGECVAAHKGVTEYKPRSAAAEDIRCLASEFWQRIEAEKGV